jgi:multiple sugar transport system ATP-binding protein
MGTRQLVTVDTEAGRLKVRAPNTLRVSDGENVSLSFNASRLVVFDGETEAAVRSDLYSEAAHG